MICPKCEVRVTEPGGAVCTVCSGSDSDDERDGAFRRLDARVRQELEDHHEIERRLGRGGMSVVYLARERELSRQVALKVLPLDLQSSPDAADRFRREAKVAASLDHPHIVPVFRIGATPTFLWFTMKVISGRSLTEIVHANGRLTLETCLDIIGQVAAALDYAHGRGIVHRDIKPGNVLIGDDGWVWVCDFGVAKSFGSAPLTQTGVPVGTPGYMSPEQCHGRTLDGCTDQYALAVLTYECLSGHPAFQADSFPEMVHKQCFAPPPRLAEVRPDLPESVSDALLRAMNKEPTKRFVDVAEFVEALGGTLIERGPTTELDVLVRGASAPPRSPAPIRRGMKWAAVIATLALFGMAAVLGRAVRFPASSPPPVPVAASPDSTPASSPPTTIRPSPEMSAAPPRRPITPPASTPPAPVAVPDSARLTVYSQPWGYLYVDGVLIGETNVPGRALPAGRHAIRIEREGYEPYERQMDFSPGQDARLTSIVLREIRPW